MLHSPPPTKHALHTTTAAAAPTTKQHRHHNQHHHHYHHDELKMATSHPSKSHHPVPDSSPPSKYALHTTITATTISHRQHHHQQYHHCRRPRAHHLAHIPVGVILSPIVPRRVSTLPVCANPANSSSVAIIVILKLKLPSRLLWMQEGHEGTVTSGGNGLNGGGRVEGWG